MGPCSVKGADISRKLVYIRVNEGENPKAFNITQIKKNLSSGITVNSFFTSLPDTIYQFSSNTQYDDNILEVFAAEPVGISSPQADDPLKMADKKKFKNY